jgi:hypothetical protein
MQQVFLSSPSSESLSTSPFSIDSPLVAPPPIVPTASHLEHPILSSETDDVCKSDAGAEGESDEDSESEDSMNSDYANSDDDYSPGPSRYRKSSNTKHARTLSSSNSSSAARLSRAAQVVRYSPYTLLRPASSTPSCSDFDSPCPRTAQLRHTSARKEQVSLLDETPKVSQKSAKCWSCMHCDYVQKNHRRPDLKRHIAGHYPSVANVCCGVPIEQAARYGIVDVSEAAEYQGELWIGGCWQVFSRRDALIRHLKNQKKKCVSYLMPSKTLKTRK